MNNLMNNIIDPQTLEQYSIFSKQGKRLLKKYINKYYENLQSGGFVGTKEALKEVVKKALQSVKLI